MTYPLIALNITKTIPPSVANGFRPTKTVLDDLSLAIPVQTMTAIIGPSGAGKSSLLKVLAGINRPSSGQLLVHGSDLAENLADLAPQLGYVAQDDIVQVDLTVRETLDYAARLRLSNALSAAERQTRVETVLAQVALTEQRDDLVRYLSGGQRKRVSIALELISDPAILLLDEPTNGLDPHLAESVMVLLRKLVRLGKTVVLVTHGLDSLHWCDQVVLLAPGGQLAFVGPPKQMPAYFKVNGMGQIYQQLMAESRPDRMSRPGDTASWAQRFRTQSEEYYQYVAGPLATYRFNHSDDSAIQQFSASTSYRLAESPTRRVIESLNRPIVESLTLLQRDWQLARRDRYGLLIRLGQAPLIGLFFGLIIRDPNLFRPCVSVVEGLTCVLQATQVTDLQTVLFLMACVGSWLGLVNANQIIIRERAVYQRERFAGLSLTSYLATKLLALGGLALLQASLLLFTLQLVIHLPRDGVMLWGGLELGLTFALVTWAASGLGLCMSALVGRASQLAYLLPIVLVVQVLFAGVIFPFELGWFISLLTLSRWAIKAFGATLNLALLWDATRFGSGQIGHIPFAYHANPAYLLGNWLMLALFAFNFMLLTVFGLRVGNESSE